MTRPRRSMKSTPRLDAMEQRLVLSQATAAPVVQAIVHRPPALVQLQLQQQQRLNAEPQAQAQVQAQSQAQTRAQLRLQTLADGPRRGQANQDPGGPQAARAAHREEIRLQMEQGRERARERRERLAAADPASSYKVHASTTDTGGFSFSKLWDSIFPW